jgi:hypothetical protein
VSRSIRTISPLVTIPILAVVAALLVWLIPEEQTLEWVIRLVLLHGALVQAALLLFAAAGLLAVVYLFTRRPALYGWLTALQQASVLMWIIYFASSMVVTYLSWGEWIAWSEPRTQASVHVLWFSVVSLLLTWWVANRTFTALVNIVVAGVAWFLVKGATIFRHPFNPVGESGSALYQWLLPALALVILLLGVEITRLLHGIGQRRALAAAAPRLVP